MFAGKIYEKSEGMYKEEYAGQRITKPKQQKKRAEENRRQQKRAEKSRRA